MRSSPGLLKGLIVFFAWGLAFALHAVADRDKGLDRQPFSLDINRSSSKELEALPYVGKAMAERIVRERLRHGFYQGPEALQRVRGIGKKRIKQIAPYLVFAPKKQE